MTANLRAKSWNIYDAVLVFLTVQLFRDLLMRFLSLLGFSFSPPLTFLIKFTAALLGLFLAHLFVERLYPQSRLSLGLIQEKPVWYLGVGFLAGILVFLSNVAYGFFLRYLGAPSSGFLFYSTLLSAGDLWDRVFLLLALVLVLPVVTEVSMRGYLYRAVEDRYGSDIGIVVTGLVFSLSFLDFWLLPPLLVASVACVLVYEMTNSLFTSIYTMGFFQLFSAVYVWLFWSIG